MSSAALMLAILVGGGALIVAVIAVGVLVEDHLRDKARKVTSRIEGDR